MYIEFPDGYDVADINVSTLTLNDTIPASYRPAAIGDHDADGIPDLMAKFDRAAVQQYLLDSTDLSEHFVTVTLTLTGYLNDGTAFAGSDTVRIIVPMKH